MPTSNTAASKVWQADILTEDDLEERLSRPTPELVQDLAAIPGDVLILGVGGKMGPSLARMAKRALLAAGQPERRVLGVARFTEPGLQERLRAYGVETFACDLLDPVQFDALPQCANVIYMAARKFGATGNEPLTWAVNTYLPGRVAERFAHSRIVCFSTGNVYPFLPPASGGATEDVAPAPIGEYAQSCLGRERLIQHFSAARRTAATILRLNYAVELRYGVLRDLADVVLRGEPVSMAMGSVNVIWQADANDIALRALRLATSPPTVLNVTGAETLSVRWLVQRLAQLMNMAPPALLGEEAPTALLSNAARCHRLLGPPKVQIEQILRWVAHWAAAGGRGLSKPTRFQVRDGRF